MKEFRYRFNFVKVKEGDLTGIQIQAIDQLALSDDDHFSGAFACEDSEQLDNIVSHLNMIMTELLHLMSDKMECVDIELLCEELDRRKKANEKAADV
jgi:hypothetical protein